jgi:hypothetical protein
MAQKRNHYRRSEGWIYFIGCSEPLSIKIGFTSKAPQERLKQLQTGNPMPLLLLGWYPGTTKDERIIHEKLAHLKMQGEWFRLDPAMNDLLRGPVLLMRINNQLTGHCLTLGEERYCG